MKVIHYSVACLLLILCASNLPYIKSDLQTFAYQGQIIRAELMVSAITFVDGSQWDGGEMFYPYPDNPNRSSIPSTRTTNQRPTSRNR